MRGVDAMEPSDLNQYCVVMAEIHRRCGVIWALQHGTCSTPHVDTTIETTLLQLRKVLELVALSSLVAHKATYQSHHADFKKAYRPKDILDRLGRVHPTFYPVPGRLRRSTSAGVYELDLTAIPEKEFLTKTEFSDVYWRCGAAMHAQNPFGEPLDLDYYNLKIPRWMRKIAQLLQVHMVTLFGNERAYVVQMGGPKDPVSVVAADTIVRTNVGLTNASSRPA